MNERRGMRGRGLATAPPPPKKKPLLEEERGLTGAQVDALLAERRRQWEGPRSNGFTRSILLTIYLAITLSIAGSVTIVFLKHELLYQAPLIAFALVLLLLLWAHIGAWFLRPFLPREGAP